ncbi:MAG: hypothetical protein GX458_19065 [Phyllobacteriaceae bacterium]|nr:hypothetical protein [Phyllobacteriaceae bacterium]
MSAPAAPAAPDLEPIDLVYLWVDGSDPDFRRLKRAHLVGEAGRLDDAELSGDEARYLQMGEIAYSVRSARRFAPWIRTVFVVVKPGQKPPLDLDDPSIRLVEEPDILPAEILPTFASPSIEPFVHRIPGLSEVFVYANDDFLFWRPTPRAYFYADGRLCLRGRHESRWRARLEAATHRGHTRIVARTALMLFDLGFRRVHLPEHSFHVMRRSTCERVWRELDAPLRAAVALRFRDDDRSLFWQSLVNSFEERDHPTRTVRTFDAVLLSFAHVEESRWIAAWIRLRMAVLRLVAPRTLCVNTVPRSWQARVRAFLDRHYATGR